MTISPPPFWPTRDPEKPVPVNLFLAIVPPPLARSRIYELAVYLQRAHRLRGNLIKPDNLHGSLHALGRSAFSSSRASRWLKSALAGVAFPKFEVLFDQVKSFSVGRERNPLVLVGSDGLRPMRELHRVLGRELVRSGFGSTVRSQFEPHVTTLWGDRLIDAYPIAPIRWRVDEFVLVVSLVGHSQHLHVERWPLLD